MNCVLRTANFIHNTKMFMRVLYQELKHTLFCGIHKDYKTKSYFLHFDETYKNKSFTIQDNIIIHSDGEHIYINDIKTNEDFVVIYDNDYEYPYTIDKCIPDYFNPEQKQIQNPFLSIIVNDNECKVDEYLSVYKRLPKTNIEDWLPTDEEFDRIECITILGEEIECKSNERLTLI
jgi:hypothetical protein